MARHFRVKLMFYSADLYLTLLDAYIRASEKVSFPDFLTFVQKYCAQCTKHTAALAKYINLIADNIL